MEKQEYPTHEERLKIEDEAWNDAMEEYETADGKSKEALRLLRGIQDYNF